jgi:hypothetical protein
MITSEETIVSILIASILSLITGIISFLTTLLAITAYFYSLSIRQAYQNLLFLILLVNALFYSMNVIFLHWHVSNKQNILSIDWVCNLNGFLNLFCC